MTRIRTEQLAMVAAAIAAFTWGIFWIPLRALDAAGISGVWAVVLFYLLPLAILLPLMLWRSRRLVQGGRALHGAGILAGMALVLYAGALVFTDVVRALVFFYLTPIWSTFLARLILSEAITPLRWATFALGALGLLLLLRLEGGLAAAFNIGDWMGLASGLVWACAAVWMKAMGEGNPLDLTLSYFLWGSLAALALLALPFEGAGPLPDLARVWSVLWWMLPVALFLVIPPAFAILWGATILSPGLLSILFMTEISAGAITAAIWADEPFGWREVAGILAITCAGIIEPVAQLRRS